MPGMLHFQVGERPAFPDFPFEQLCGVLCRTFFPALPGLTILKWFHRRSKTFVSARPVPERIPAASLDSIFSNPLVQQPQGGSHLVRVLRSAVVDRDRK